MRRNNFASHLLLLAFGVAWLAVNPANASAALRMRLSTGSGATITLTDQVADGPGGVPDDAASGILGVLSTGIFSLGNFTIQSTDITSKPIIGGMHLHNLSITSAVADTLLIETVDDSFAAVGPGFFNVSYSASFSSTVPLGTTAGSSVAFAYYIDPANGGAFSTGTGVFAGAIVPPPDSGANAGWVAHGNLASYSLGLNAYVVLGANQQMSLDFIVNESSLAQGPPLAPEPTGLVIWGLGLGTAGLTWYRRRRRATV